MYTIVFLSSLGVLSFIPKSPETFSILFQHINVISMLMDSFGISLKGRFWGGICRKRPKIGKFATVQYGPICSMG
jgi:hypothetical protein